MGLLDNLIGALGGGSEPGQGGGALLQHLSAMLTSGQTAGGGLPGLVQAFQQSGLSHVIGSWIGGGPNQPISAEQLQQVLGPDRIAAIAQSLGLPPGQITSQLTQLLPELINHLTPSGQLPTGGVAHADVASALTAVLGRLAGGVSPPNV
jgi:uncharacterized protein YidB (DUF937 family)